MRPVSTIINIEDDIPDDTHFVTSSTTTTVSVTPESSSTSLSVTTPTTSTVQSPGPELAPTSLSVTIPVKTKESSSGLWKYLKKNYTSSNIECLVPNCKTTYSLTTGNGTLKRHLITKHNFDNDLKPPTTPISIIPDFFRKIAPEVLIEEADLEPVTNEFKERLTALLTLMIIRDDLSFRFVESPSLYDLLKECVPNLVREDLPSRRTIRRRLLYIIKRTIKTVFASTNFKN
ncbi:hypothetical protein RCL1_005949 [Eukaryota sp. TZLM3-RCL]